MSYELIASQIINRCHFDYGFAYVVERSVKTTSAANESFYLREVDATYRRLCSLKRRAALTPAASLETRICQPNRPRNALTGHFDQLNIRRRSM